jgi:hypothetical protein
MGLYFGFSEFTVSQYLERLKPILKATLEQNTSLISTVFKDQSAFDEAFKNVDEIYIDVTEIPTERSQNKQIQENHTFKWLIICDKNKRILFTSAMFNGKTDEQKIQIVLIQELGLALKMQSLR